MSSCSCQTVIASVNLSRLFVVKRVMVVNQPREFRYFWFWEAKFPATFHRANARKNCWTATAGERLLTRTFGEIWQKQWRDESENESPSLVTQLSYLPCEFQTFVSPSSWIIVRFRATCGAPPLEFRYLWWISCGSLAQSLKRRNENYTSERFMQELCASY